jgi:hypothetical protein
MAALLLWSAACTPHLDTILLALEGSLENGTIGRAIEREKVHEIHKLCLPAGGPGS